MTRDLQRECGTSTQTLKKLTAPISTPPVHGQNYSNNISSWRAFSINQEDVTCHLKIRGASKKNGNPVAAIIKAEICQFWSHF
jgi:hypothetical protein